MAGFSPATTDTTLVSAMFEHHKQLVWVTSAVQRHFVTDACQSHAYLDDCCREKDDQKVGELHDDRQGVLGLSSQRAQRRLLQHGRTHGNTCPNYQVCITNIRTAGHCLALFSFRKALGRVNTPGSVFAVTGGTC